MRIAMISWESLYSVSVGGVSVHVSRLADALRRAGHELHVFTRLGPDQRLEDNVFGVQYHRCPSDPRDNFVDEVQALCAVFAHYLQTTAERNGPFDIVHCHDWLTAPAGMTLAEQSGIRYAQTFHTTEWGRTGVWPEQGDPKRIADIEKQAVEKADIVFVSSEDARRRLDQAYQCADWKKRVVYHGIDVRPFDAEPFDAGAVKTAVGIGPMAPTVLFVGRLSHRKGPDLLVDAAHRLAGEVPGVRVLLVGAGDMEDHLRKQVERQGLGETVRFLGWKGGKDLIDLYRACDCVCCPSRVDPFGVVALSAWAAGKPVVATLSGAPGEFVKHGDNGLLVDASADALAEGLIEILSDFDRLRWMGQNGRVAAETAFIWNEAAARTLTAYKDCTAAGTGSVR